MILEIIILMKKLKIILKQCYNSLDKNGEFYNTLIMKNISDDEYEKVKLFYKKMKFKNLREYLECYLT